MSMSGIQPIVLGTPIAAAMCLLPNYAWSGRAATARARPGAPANGRSPQRAFGTRVRPLNASFRHQHHIFAATTRLTVS